MDKVLQSRKFTAFGRCLISINVNGLMLIRLTCSGQGIALSDYLEHFAQHDSLLEVKTTNPIKQRVIDSGEDFPVDDPRIVYDVYDPIFYKSNPLVDV